MFLHYGTVKILLLLREAFRVRINFHKNELHTTSYFINEWLMSNVLESNQRIKKTLGPTSAARNVRISADGKAEIQKKITSRKDFSLCCSPKRL